VTPAELAWIGTHHATPSVATFALSIELETSRVFSRLPPGSAHVDAGLGESLSVAPFAGVAAECVARQPAALDLLVLAQPPTTAPVAIINTTPATEAPATRRLIDFPFYPSSVPNSVSDNADRVRTERHRIPRKSGGPGGTYVCGLMPSALARS
jgi:hypothetical protein